MKRGARLKHISTIICQDMQPVRRPETVCPVCKGYMIHKGFELDESATHIVIHYGCNDCGVHIKQHFSCKYERTETDKIPDRKTRLEQASCDHYFQYRNTQSSGGSDFRVVWDNYQCALCGKIEHRNERYEATE